jgi:hypothetical protein
VGKQQLFGGGMSSFDMIDGIEEIGKITKRACDSSQAAYVLGMIPAGIVAAAVCVRNECDARGTPAVSYLTGLRLRRAKRSVEPSFAPDADSVALSSRTSNPRSFTTKSVIGSPAGKNRLSAAFFTVSTVLAGDASTRNASHSSAA